MFDLEPFGFDLLRKYGAAFGACFNQVQLPRYDANNNLTELIDVPFTYATKEKVLARVVGDPNIDRPTAVVLPRMSYVLQSMTYDPARKLNSVERIAVSSNTGSEVVYDFQFTPVPFNLHYTVWLYSKNMEDANRIMEQVLPWFEPEFTLRLNLIPEMLVTINTPVVLDSVSLDDVWEGNLKDRRMLSWRMDFTMKAFFYQPIHDQPIIKFANVNFYIPSTNTIAEGVGNTKPIDRVTVQPGLDANGNPTTNLAVTIPYQQINANDNWAYIVTIYGDLDNEGDR